VSFKKAKKIKQGKCFWIKDLSVQERLFEGLASGITRQAVLLNPQGNKI